MLVQAALAATKVKNSSLRARYFSLKPRLGHKKAIIAVAAAMLRIIYHMLKDGTFYQDLGPDYRRTRNPERAARSLANRIRSLGFVVENQKGRMTPTFQERSAYDETLATAVKRKHEPQRFVGDLLKAEISENQARSIKYQLTVAKLPLAEDVDDFAFKDTPINEALVRDLAGGGFIAQQRNVVLVGGTEPDS